MHHIMIIYAYIYPPYYRDISYFVSMRFIFLMIWIYSFCDRVGQGVRPYSHTGKIFNAYPMEVKQTTIEIYTYIYILFFIFMYLVLNSTTQYIVGLNGILFGQQCFFPFGSFLHVASRCRWPMESKQERILLQVTSTNPQVLQVAYNYNI